LFFENGGCLLTIHDFRQHLLNFLREHSVLLLVAGGFEGFGIFFPRIGNRAQFHDHIKAVAEVVTFSSAAHPDWLKLPGRSPNVPVATMA